jgi:hypothetical protein
MRRLSGESFLLEGRVVRDSGLANSRGMCWPQLNLDAVLMIARVLL